MAAEPVIDLERMLRGARRLVHLDEPGQVVGVDGFARPEPQLPLERAAGEVEPGLVEVGRHALRVVGPDHDGRRVGHAAETLLALAQGLLGAAALRDVVDDADHADDLPGRVAVGAVRRDQPAGVAGLGDRVPDVGGGSRVAAEGALEQPVDALFAQEREDVEGPAAEDLAGGQARHALHVLVPDDQPQVPVVDDDPFAGAGDDLLAELVGFLELLAGALSLRDVLDHTLVVEQPPRRVSDRTGALADGDDLAAVALPLELHVVDLALALEFLEERAARLRVDVDLAHVDGHEALARREAQQVQQGGIGVEDLPRERGAIEPDGHALEERPVASLGFADDAPAGRLLERRANRGDEAGKVVGVLQDVVVEARLHRGNRELLATRAGAEQDREIGAPFADPAQKVERVDPARPVIGDDDVEVVCFDEAVERGGLLQADDLRAGNLRLDGLDDQSPVARALVDDENPQRFARRPARPVGLAPAVASDGIT